MKRKICVVTGSRADYGLLKLIMLGIMEDTELELQIIATGMHLARDYGLTYREIELDGFKINRKIECLTQSDDALSISNATAAAISGSAKAFQELKPDIVLLLGDRFEILAVSIASLFARIPIAHIHGGELTLGAFDESMRHAITKMSNIHFVTHEEYRHRVIQLGESPDHVHLIGSLSRDVIKSLNLLNRKEIEEVLNLKFKRKSLLITFHPATLDEESPESQMRELLSALEKLSDTTLIFTMPNADTGGYSIMDLISRFVQENDNAYVFNSLGQLLYISCMAIVDGVVGNSSSGITEAPVMGKGTINIGIRQLGRIQNYGVINCKATQNEIESAISFLYSHEFVNGMQQEQESHSQVNASLKILSVLREVELQGITLKPFWDISFNIEENLKTE